MSQCKLLGQVQTLSGCKWNKQQVILNTGGLYGLGGISPQDIDKIAQEQAKKVMKVCQMQITVSRSQPGDIVTVWGTQSAHYMPCQEQPARGWLDVNAVDGMPSVDEKKRLLRWLFAHESLGHGLGLDHGGDGIMKGFDPNGNPNSDLDEWTINQLRQRYGVKLMGWYAVSGDMIKNNVTPPNLDKFPAIENAKWVKAAPSKSGYYFGTLNNDQNLLVRIKGNGQIVDFNGTERKKDEFKEWFGPVIAPKKN